jgi:serine/threonine protein kinase
VAPEQWRPEELDGLTDIYAVGYIIYEMFTGHWVFQAASIDIVRCFYMEEIDNVLSCS